MSRVAPRPLPSERTALVFLVLSALLAGILFPLTGALAGIQDGDGILTSLISTQRVTWYFWGQDRLLNLFPALASPLHNVEWNLHFQIFLRSFCAYLAPLGVLVFLDRTPRVLAVSVALTNIILIVCASHYMQFNIYVQHNTFGISLVAFAIAYLIAHSSMHRVLVWLCVGALCTLAYATNYALLIYSLPVVAGFGIVRWRQWRLYAPFLVVNIIAVGLAHFHARAFGESQTELGTHVSLDAILLSIETVRQNVNMVLLGLAALAGAVCFFVRRDNRWLEYLGVLAIVVAMFMVLASTVWVQMNLYNARYFITCSIVLVALISYSLTITLLSNERSAYGLCVLGLTGVVFTSFMGFQDNYRELVGATWRATSLEVARVAEESQAVLIVGDFWDVWPAVYDAALLRPKHETPVYGAAFRGHPMQHKVLAELRKPGEHVALCFHATSEACLNEIVNSLQLRDVKLQVDGQESVVVAGRSLLKLKVSLQ